MEAKKRDGGVITDYADDVGDALRDLFGVKKKNELVTVKPEAEVPAAKPADTPEALPSTTPAVKTDVAPAVKTDVAPTVKTDVAPAVRTDVAPAVKTDVAPSVRTDVAPKVRTDTTPQVRSPQPPKGRDVRPPGRFRDMIPPSMGVTPGQEVAIGAIGVFNVPSYLHMASERRVFEQNEADKADKERRNIENVPRPKSDRNKAMARNESIKKNIIDENVKKKAIIKSAIDSKYSKSVEIAPEIKKDLQEKRGFAGTALGTTGLGLGATQGSNIEKKFQDMGLQNPESQRTGFDTVLDVASMIPVVGAVPSAISAYRSLKRGDYVDAALDAAGAIPGLGILTKGLKIGGKLAKGGGAMSGLTGIGDVTQRVGGKTLVSPALSSSSAAGKTVDTISNTAEKIATPGNLFQLGQTAEPFAKEIGSVAKDVYDQKIANPNQSTVKKPQTK